MSFDEMRVGGRDAPAGWRAWSNIMYTNSRELGDRTQPMRTGEER